MYSCDKCEYEANLEGNLKQHKKSIYEGNQYVSNKCNYQTTQQSSTMPHIIHT